MELLCEIAIKMSGESDVVTKKELFIDNIDNFGMFIPLPGKSREESAKISYSKITVKRWEQMYKSITLDYICDTVDLRHKERRLKRFEKQFVCKRVEKKLNLVIEIPWDHIEEQRVEKTTLGKRKYLIVSGEYPQLYFTKSVDGVEPCPICYEAFDSWEGVCRPNGCLHHYHIDCLKPWFEGKNMPNCPYCRVYCTGFNYILRKKDKKRGNRKRGNRRR